jgi:hypothetical protein
MTHRSSQFHTDPEGGGPRREMREIFVSPWPTSYLEQRRGDWLCFILPSMFVGSALAGAIVLFAFAILASIPAAGVVLAIGVVIAMRRAAQRRLKLAPVRASTRRPGASQS